MKIKYLLTAILTFSLWLGHAVTNSMTVYANIGSASILHDVFFDIANTYGLNMGFARIIALSVDPFIAITGLVVSYNFELEIILFLAGLIALKMLLDTFRGTKILCDALLGKIEFVVGAILVLAVAFLNSTAVVVYASENLLSSYPTSNTLSTLVLTLISVVVSTFSYISYYVIRTMVKGLETISFLFALFPVAFQVLQGLKYSLSIAYVLLALHSPVVATALGILILVISLVFFIKLKRLERYFRNIYVYPILTKIFLRKWVDEPVMKKIPPFVSKYIPDPLVCKAVFIGKNKHNIPKRAKIYFACSQDVSLIFRKGLLSEWKVFEVDKSDLLLERRFRFSRFRAKEVDIIFRRDYTNTVVGLEQLHTFKEIEATGKKLLLQYL